MNVKEDGQSGSSDAEKAYQELVGGMERVLAEAKDKHQKVKAGIYVTRWLLDNYPAITGRMTIDDLMDFLKGEKDKLKDDIEKNGGKA